MMDVELTSACAPTVISVEGMMCQASCGTAVQSALEGVPGVSRAVASYEDATATVWWRSLSVKDEASAVDAVEAIGFGASVAPEFVLAIDGMMCQASCGTAVRNALLAVPGVSRAVVSHPQKSAEVWGGSLSALIDAVECIGFGAEEKQAEENDDVEAPFITGETVELKLARVETGAEAKAVRAAAVAVPGVVSCDVNLMAKRAILKYHEEAVVALVCARVLSETGLECEVLSTAATAGSVIMRVEGMSCAACSSKVERVLAAHPTVTSATVSVATHKAKIVLKSSDGADAALLELVSAVKKLGFTASVVVDTGAATTAEDFEDASKREVRSWRNSLIAAVCLTVPLLIIVSVTDQDPMMPSGDMSTNGRVCHGRVGLGAISGLILGTCVQFFVARRYYVACWRGLLGGNYGMDALVVIATSVVYIYSVMSMAICCTMEDEHSHTMFETSAMLITFVTLGKFLEANAKQRTSGAIAALLRMQPTTALLLNEDADLAKDASKLVELFKEGDTVLIAQLEEKMDLAMRSEPSMVPCEKLEPGDVLKVLPGAAVPCDGVVLRTAGEAYVDESALTGEPTPVRKRAGEAVFGSATSRGAMFLMRASRVGSDSTLAQIAKLVEDAQLSKAPIQEYADAVASKFTPTIVTLSLLTFVCWYLYATSKSFPRRYLDEHSEFLFALLFGVSVVVVACPCALGLATPTAVMVGTGVGAQLGVLIKGGDVLEVASQVDCVVFDKTGTLTTGKPTLTDEIDLRKDNQSVGPLLLAASAEQASEHPIAKAILGAARSQGFGREDFESVSDSRAVEGAGVTCLLAKSGAVGVGNVVLMRKLGVPGIDAPRVQEALHDLQINAKTAVLVAREGELVGILAVADPLRPEARSAVASLLARDVQVRLLTGDNEKTAMAVARKVGLATQFVSSDLLPAHKAEAIKELQSQSLKVAMVGDGVNDSPALAQADVGIAIGGGTHVAIETADVVLIRDHLHQVVVALDLARTVYTRIKINFFWAAIYNVILIPVAAGALYPVTRTRLHPAYAALCMAFSSVSVVCSSLTLKFYKPPPLGDAEYVTKMRQRRKWFFCSQLRHRCRLLLFSITGTHLYSKCLEDGSMHEKDRDAGPFDDDLSTSPLHGL